MGRSRSLIEQGQTAVAIFRAAYSGPEIALALHIVSRGSGKYIPEGFKVLLSWAARARRLLKRRRVKTKIATSNTTHTTTTAINAPVNNDFDGGMASLLSLCVEEGRGGDNDEEKVDPALAIVHHPIHNQSMKSIL
ncbi:hypothetical protein MPER_10020 [Moniliophthora perniciosa FA553]|nr:hypothetical protein MPER_10020 [Moniliophthora perniciosa FA553]